LGNPKYIALKKPNAPDYTWYEWRPCPLEIPETPPGAVSYIYRGTGRFVQREDGEEAEVYEQNIK